MVPPTREPSVGRRTAELGLGPVDYTLRRSHRSRGIRVTIDPLRGVLVSVPLPTRPGWARPEPLIEAFFIEREGWLRRHLTRQQRQRAALAARGPLGDGSRVRYAGELHRLEVGAAPSDDRRSLVARHVRIDEPVLTVALSGADARDLATVLRDWCRERAREAILLAVADHAVGLAVAPAAVAIRDPRTRWGSASKAGRLSFSWRLVLAPREALETVVVHELAHLRVFGHGPRFWSLVAGRRPDHALWRRWLRDHAQELHAAFTDGPSSSAEGVA
jgi:predicted metal-dependent hydrolase